MSDLSPKMIKEIERYFPDLGPNAFEGFTSESHRSEYRGAQEDIKVYDAAGNVAFYGRHFASTGTAYWRPTRVAVVPEFVATTEATLVPAKP